jgi:hypothetical protein
MVVDAAAAVDPAAAVALRLRTARPTISVEAAGSAVTTTSRS